MNFCSSTPTLWPSSQVKGPVPTVMSVNIASSPLASNQDLLNITAARSVKASMAVALGSTKFNSRVKSSRQDEASMSRKPSLPCISLVVRPSPVAIVSRVKRASSQVKGSPLCQVMPSWKNIVTPVVPSWLVQPLARSGMIFLAS